MILILSIASREKALCAMTDERASFTQTLTLKLQQEMRRGPCPLLMEST